ncbi:MAG: hypothetical protein LBB30_05065 [Candidatus Methanoplasma sp.]|jgi:hypothetical protein|nr:hypothetical protein [Candidatus Methanoplasma sp.]
METYRMRKLGVRSAKPADGGFLPASDDDQEVWFRREWRLITLLAIMIVAFVIRFIFAYGVSAGSDFALSGGSGASNHAHVIESILNGSFAFTDPALNYPYGSVNVYPPLMDFLLAGVAGIVSMFGISAGTAAAGTLAFSAPIFAALTCWPVYLIGRKMFNDEKIGLLAALFYAFFALLIMTTVFSNGTEYAFIGFLFAFMIYFLLKALDDCDRIQPDGFRAMLGDRKVLINLLVAGILFAMIAMSWNQFRIILVMLVFIMVAQAVADRLRSKAVSPTVGVYSSVIMLGMLISAPVYILAGLWDLVFSGPFVVAVMSVALAAFFSKTTDRSWVLMIPVTLIIAAAALAALFFISGDLFSATVGGNSLYTNELMSQLASVTTMTSISSMASFFGWVSVWLPFVMFLYMLYKYRGNMDSRKYTFSMWLILLLFGIGWYSTSYAAIAGAGFAVSSAALILMAIRSADLKSYFADMRGNGVKHALRKALKPIPLVATIAIVALVAVPNVVYAADASTPTNTEDGGYFGGLGYTVMTDDINSINRMWNEYSGVSKDGALVTWYGHSTDAVSRGGFDSVTDAFGGGTSAMSAILLANSGSAATAAMAIRLMLANDLSSFSLVIQSVGLNYSTIERYVNNPSAAVDEVRKNVEVYDGISQNVTEENALYLVLTNYITSTIPESKVNELYNGICGISHESIRYVSVDRTLLPLYYNDRTYFTTAAYFGSYAIGAYGAPAHFFSYDSYSGYAMYMDAMYDTFFWKSLIGMSPAEAGYNSAFNYLDALALSDGTVKANPGYGLPNYKVAYWHVFYNPDSNVTSIAADGWEEMDAYEAIQRQNSAGGLINYINGVVMMEYDPTMTTSLSGTVNYMSSSGTAGAEGIQVSVFVKKDYDTSVAAGYMKKSTVFTKADGSYTISVPVGVDYYVVFSSGTNSTATGSVIETRWNMTAANAVLNIPATSLSGNVYVTSDPYKPYTEKSYAVIEGMASGGIYQKDINITDGKFEFPNIIPDIYRLTIYSPSGTTINAATVTINAGSNTGYRISATSGTITVTVTNDVGANAPNGTAITAQDTSTGAIFTGTVDNGQAKIYVVPSTYVIYASGTKVSASNPTSSVSSGGTSTASLTVYDPRNISVSGAPAGSILTIMSYGYVASSSSSTFSVPAGGGSTNETYTVYAVSGGNVYHGVTAGNSVSLIGSTGYNVKGTVNDSKNDPFSGTVSFIKKDNGATFIFASDEDGKFSVKLPAGIYTMYIYGQGAASITTVTVSEDMDLGVIKASESRDIVINVNYRTNMSSPSSRGIAFVDVTITITIDEIEYTIITKTDASGKAAFRVPIGHGATITSPGFNTAIFRMDAQSSNFASGSADALNTWSIAASGSTDSFVKTVNVNNGTIPVKLTLYNSSSTTYEGTTFTNVIPGQYTAEIKGSTGYYFTGTVYIYPGQSGPLNISAYNVVRVELNASSSDKITVTPTDEEAGRYYADGDNPLVYYLQRNKSFYFEAVSGSGGNESIAYASVSNISAPMTLNLSVKADKAVIKGYVGVIADGVLTVKYGSVSVPFGIKDGAFEMVVPSGTALSLSAELTQTIGNVEYKYTATTSMTAAETVDGANIHFPATTSSSNNMLEVSGSGFSFLNGYGSFTLSVKNTSSFNETYTIKAGSAWVLDKEYAISVNAGMTGTISISGRYDPDRVGAGNDGLSVTVTSINGTAVGTYVLDETAFPTTAPPTVTYVDISGENASKGTYVDAVSGYEYMYAVTITNNDNYLKRASVTASLVGSSSNWSIVYSDKNGGNIYPATGANSFKVNGYGSTVIYIKLMCRDASDTSVPDINVTVTMPGQTLATNSGGVAPVGDTATFKMSSQPAEMETEDMSASGSNIYNDQSSMPPLAMVLTALTVLALIVMVWLGIKKGVFVRRR